MHLLVVIGLIVVIGWYTLLTRVHKGEGAERIKCTANLKWIGNALVLYLNANRGLFPRTQSVDGAPISLTNDGFADVNAFVILPAGGKINNIP